jgi:hypothetical protein
VIVAHIMGIPVEESFLQLAPAGAVTVTAVFFVTTRARARFREAFGVRFRRGGRAIRD